MTQVVYADILIVVNTYINYALLRITALICHKKTSALRLTLCAFLGSFYSFIILFDSIPGWLMLLTKMIFAVTIVLSAFKLSGKREFLRLTGSFFLVNFAFAGIMFVLWFAIAPSKMLFNNGIVYFDLDSITLIVLTIICYLALKLITKYISFKVPGNTVYEIEFEYCGHKFFASAFLDTGNSLKEPFSSLPVIVAYGEMKSTDSNEKKLSELANERAEKLRYIPCATISKATVMKAFKPDIVRIKGIEVDFSAKDVYIALTDKKISGSDYAVLLNPAIFENNTKETEKDYV